MAPIFAIIRYALLETFFCIPILPKTSGGCTAAKALNLLLYSRSNCRFLRSSGFRFQYPRHFVGGGGRGIFLEIAGHDKDGIAHADFRHAVGAAGGAGVVLLVICHRQYSFQSVISFFMLSIFRLAVSCRKLSPVKRTGTHMESRRS